MDYGIQWRLRKVAVRALIVSTFAAHILSAAVAPSLGSAAAFGVLGGSTVTNTGPTVINGSLGVSPGSAVTGFPPGIVVAPGTIHAADASAADAESDTTIAYNALAGLACNANLTGQDLGGLTLIPGVYCFSSSAQLTGALTLDAQGNANAVFVVQIGTTLTTASNSSVNIINGGSACNVFWQIGTSATLGTTTSFRGNILALASITLNTGANMAGRALARNGAVTLDSNVVSITECSSSLVAAPILGKSFGAVLSIPRGGTTVLTFTVSNPNVTIPLTGVGFIDSLPSGLLVATPNGVTGSCGGGTITATAGSGSIRLTGATLGGGASCTFGVNVTAVNEGVWTNVTGGVISVNGGLGSAASASIAVGAFRKGYVSNLSVGDSVVNISNSGASGASLQSGTTATITGSICLNVYAFTPDEQMVSCCSCPVTPNGLVALSAKNDLASNTLTPAVPTALVITLVATAPVAGSCNNSAAAVATETLTPGMLAWSSTIHATPTPGAYGVTETPVLPAALSSGELNRLGQLCNFILANGSGFGVCRSCRLGGLGTDRQ